MSKGNNIKNTEGGMKEMIEKMEALVDFSPKYHDYKIGRKWHRRQTNRPPRVTLKSMAEFVNGHMEGYTAKMEQGYYSGDSRISGTRFRREGKDYYGNKIVITDKTRKEIVEHDATDPCRRNDEVAKWILRHIERS